MGYSSWGCKTEGLTLPLNNSLRLGQRWVKTLWLWGRGSSLGTPPALACYRRSRGHVQARHCPAGPWRLFSRRGPWTQAACEDRYGWGSCLLPQVLLLHQSEGLSISEKKEQAQRPCRPQAPQAPKDTARPVSCRSPEGSGRRTHAWLLLVVSRVLPWGPSFSC